LDASDLGHADTFKPFDKDAIWGGTLPQLALFTHKPHQPVGEILPSTNLQALGETKFAQSSQSWPSFGDG
jgi:hypothetical protein